MGISWKNRFRKIMIQMLLGAMLIAPAAVSSTELPPAGSCQEEAQGQEETPDGSQPATGLAVGELPGDGDDDGTGIMPCGDWDKERNVVKSSN